MPFIWLVSIILFICLAVIAVLIIKIRQDKNALPPYYHDCLLPRSGLKVHASELAQNQRCRIGRKKTIINIDDDVKQIDNLQRLLQGTEPCFKAAEWFVDNYFLIKGEINAWRAEDKFKYLPLMSDGNNSNIPRMFFLANELISHTDAELDNDTIIEFFEAYQDFAPLGIAELESMKAFIRIALLRCASAVARNLTYAISTDEIAQKWRERLLSDPSSVNQLINMNVKGFDAVFAERLLFRLMESDDERSDQISGIIRRAIAQAGGDIDSIVRTAQNEYSRMTKLIGNIITSMRTLSRINWGEIFDSLSLVDRIFRSEKSGIYHQMDEESRRYYRKQAQNYARKTGLSELRIAAASVELADAAGLHCGLYLAGRKKEEMLKKIAADTGIKRLRILSTGQRFLLYYGSVILLTVAGMFTITGFTFSLTSSVWTSIIAAVIFSVPVYSAVLALINRIATLFVHPMHIPKLDFQGYGIPQEHSAAVVIPVLLTGEKAALESVRQLELHYLSNKSNNLYFVLLGDYADASKETMPEDEAIYLSSKKAVNELNKKYGTERFFYLQRSRTWNERQNSWMGWERKRGALMQLALFMRFKEDPFIDQGQSVTLASCKYLITVDQDTIIGSGNCAKLIGAMAHPNNAPVVADGKMIFGYGVMQPSMTMFLSNSMTRFTLLFSGNKGFDSYSFHASNLMQDIFREGTFSGKGILDIDSVLSLLNKAIRPNSILSHDLLEGCLLRCAQVNDVKFMEGFPSNYISYSMRQHRWHRGDWQLLPWFLSKLKNSTGIRTKNPLNYLCKYKILDNLRRSLEPVFIFAMFVFILAVFKNPWPWLLIGIVLVYFSIFIEALDRIFTLAKTGIGGIDCYRQLKLSFSRLTARFVFSANDTVLSVDALIRTLLRLIRQKRLLDWVTAAQTERNNDKLSHYVRALWPGEVLSVLAYILVVLLKPDNLFIALFVSLSWCFAALLAHGLSLPSVIKQKPLESSKVQMLRNIAFRTWGYFEKFLDEKNNYLIPDNYQEDPKPGIAHRTSPTNIGLGLMSVIQAHDFGYIGLADTLDYCRRILDAIDKLPKWNGHLYNWTDTQTTEPLYPRYISAVDSGNLASYLITVEQALKELEYAFLFDNRQIKALNDICVTASGTSEYEGIQRICLDAISCRDVFCWARAITEVSENKIIRNSKDVLSSVVGSALRDMERFMPYILVLNSMEARDCQGAVKLETVKDFVRNSIKLSDCNRLIALKDSIRELIAEEKNSDTLEKFEAASDAIDSAVKNINDIKMEITLLASKARTLAVGMDFRHLYDEKIGLFKIGLSIDTENKDENYYDLFASEARQTSYYAIAKGDVPAEHWFKMSRPLTIVDQRKMLLSWSGTMFEYLMPNIIMRNFDHTLLNESCNAVVNAQRQHFLGRHIPWGVSESAFYSFDMALNYQYKAFGIPKAGMRNVVDSDTVIAPYATALALGVDAEAAASNIEKLLSLGVMGQYGLYEAVDFTQQHMPFGSKYKQVKCFMAHHQGMILCSIGNLLHGNINVERYHRAAEIAAMEPLLQEMPPYCAVAMPGRSQDEYTDVMGLGDNIAAARYALDPNTPVPEVQVLSNGKYSLMINAAGSGYSSWNGRMLTRWREDICADAFGFFIYLRDIYTGDLWSAAYQPLKVMPALYAVSFEDGKAVCRRSDNNIETVYEVTVSPEDDVELRRITIANHSERDVEIELTGFAELSMSKQNADIAHRAFESLFLQCEILEDLGAVIAKKRARNGGLDFTAAAFICHGESITASCSRENFIGRGNTPYSPSGINQSINRNSGGTVNPAFVLRTRIKIPSGKEKKVIFAIAAAENEHELYGLIAKYRNVPAVERAFDMAHSQSVSQSTFFGIKPSHVSAYMRIASRMIYRTNASGGFMRRNLWALGISGDIPVLVVKIADAVNMPFVKSLIICHEYLKQKGVSFDLVLMDISKGGYYMEMYNRLCQVSSSYGGFCKSGGMYVIRADRHTPAQIDSLLNFARLVLDASKPIAKQLDKPQIAVSEKLIAQGAIEYEASKVIVPENIEYDNGYGGFADDGREYVIKLSGNKHTPSPWSLIMANENFGTLVTERGGGYTWAENSRQNKLTEMPSDPVGDKNSEAVYIRDNHTGEYWSAASGPIRRDGEYLIRFGQGYAVYEYNGFGIDQQMTVFVHESLPVKIIRLKLNNRTDTKRQLSCTMYSNIIGTTDKAAALGNITTGYDRVLWGKNVDSDNGYIWAISSEPFSYTTDRLEFIGRNNTLESPDAMRSQSLSNTIGGFDNCLALMNEIILPPGKEKEISFYLGFSQTLKSAVDSYEKVIEQGTEDALNKIKELWDDRLNTVSIKTHSRALDILINRWLPYQAWTSRLLARCGYYQAGGAYGFRDQLQDLLGLIWYDDAMARKLIIEFAAHQFIEGDVQHWWHPGREGARTRITDDRLFLPYVVCKYIKHTSDTSILSEMCPYIESKPLAENEHDRCDIPLETGIQEDIFQHCVRALDISLNTGEHGLPLMGTGDWNDAMDSIGDKGRGQSVWLGWFILRILQEFVPFVRERGLVEKADFYEDFSQKLLKSIEDNAWDGKWYRRAFDDDGNPIGSELNEECRIDAISQAWAVLSGVGSSVRSHMALDSACESLIDEKRGVIQLLTPPFNKSSAEPGYIKGYIPGVRENGGQYTHGAIWLLMAAARLGRCDLAWSMLEMLNPINHTRSLYEANRYSVEPYVLAADVYSAGELAGRGGWTWYTGSASWMLKAVLESICGMDKSGDKLYIKPCLPSDCPGLEIKYRYGASVYRITVYNTKGETNSISVDNKQTEYIQLIDDGQEHKVRVYA